MVCELGDGRTELGNHRISRSLGKELGFVPIERCDLVRDNEGQPEGLAVCVHSHVQPAENLGASQIVLVVTLRESAHKGRLSAEEGRDGVDDDQLDVSNARRLQAIIETVLKGDTKNREARSAIEALQMCAQIPRRCSP